MAIPARFHAIRDRTLAAVDWVMAEPVAVFPLSNERADPARVKANIEAVLRTGGGKTTNAAGGIAKTWRSRVAAGTAELHIDRAKYPDLAIRQGDKVRAMSRLGEPFFKVERVDDRSSTRLVLELTEA